MKAVLKFNPAIKFEGEEVKSIDLSGAENWSSMKYNQVVSKMRAAGYEPEGMIESNAEFAWFAGNELSGYPVEFFQALPVKYIKVINMVLMKTFMVTAEGLTEILEME